MNVIIHIDEIFLKGSNQPVFYRHLKDNLEQLLAGVMVKRTEGGMWLENIEPEQLKQLALIPGFANFAKAIKVKNTIEDIKKGVDGIIACHPEFISGSSKMLKQVQYDKKTDLSHLHRTFVQKISTVFLANK